MSYCRFSSDNWKSDIYAYEHCGGWWQIHVAGNRRAFPPIPDIPLHWIPSFGGKWSMPDRQMKYPSRWHRYAARVVFGTWALWHRLNTWTLNMIPLKPIGHAYDGCSFEEESAAACADRLEMLRSVGYHVPQHAIDRLRVEATEEEHV